MVFQKYMDRVLETADEFSENKDAILRYLEAFLFSHLSMSFCADCWLNMNILYMSTIQVYYDDESFEHDV